MALKNKQTVGDKSEHQRTRVYREIQEKKEVIPDSVFDGSIEIRNGELLFTPPRGLGRFPLIMAGENVEIYLNGKKIETPSFINDHDTVEIKTLDTAPSVDLEISIIEDKMKAFLLVKKAFGKKYALIDCKPMQIVKVIARCVIEEEPAPIQYEDVMEALQNKGVVFGIQKDAIMKAVQDTAGEFTVEIATGLFPVESVDASIMYNFQDEDWSVSARNPYGNGKIHSVSLGEIVAIKRPPVPGKPGIDVTENPALVRMPKDVPILIKDGVELINEGTVAIATRSGKPVLEGYSKKYLSVRPVYIVEGDVNLTVGNIKFKGDVIVKGSVYDGFSIEASGSIRVLGDVLHAALYANGDIVVNKKAISSRLQAGGLAVPYKWIYKMLTQLLNRLENLLAAMKLLKAQRAFTTGDLKENGEGQLVKLLIDYKFRDIPPLIYELIEIVLKEENQGLIVDLVQITQHLSQKLCNLGPLRIQHQNEIELLIQELQESLNIVDGLVVNAANIAVSYLQNSVAQANGDIIITGKASIISQLHAEGKIVINSGVVRGGHLSAREGIKVMELGSNKDGEVNISLLDNCVLEAAIAYPGIVIRHATDIKVVQEHQRYLRAQVSKGHLIVENANEY
ncbi:hypothetical protein UF75_2925 [Desulfosporosinus sp. I2]|uniref:DUF342 domain-containing protein n=1 Tax=Desulfosporosinus sp. I2 TaxID=1617025 RepID=UPI0005EFDC2F|nr:FapA family protein [Desulfosporosinus sp. I2]KJR46688.1 hypothetical protein UF75_2925 [Desulfosporosinus sp. I2]